MKIIIVGIGKVGYAIAEQMTGENHDLVVIDRNNAVLDHVDSMLDVMCVEGNGASASALLEAGVREADLLIAVSENDEVNLICCLMAKKLGAKHTVARVRNPEYFRDAPILRREIGLDMIINPENAAAQEISRILRVPSAFSVETFARGLVELIGFQTEANDTLVGKSAKIPTASSCARPSAGKRSSCRTARSSRRRATACTSSARPRRRRACCARWAGPWRPSAA